MCCLCFVSSCLWLLSWFESSPRRRRPYLRWLLWLTSYLRLLGRALTSLFHLRIGLCWSLSCTSYAKASWAYCNPDQELIGDPYLRRHCSRTLKLVALTCFTGPTWRLHPRLLHLNTGTHRMIRYHWFLLRRSWLTCFHSLLPQVLLLGRWLATWSPHRLILRVAFTSVDQPLSIQTSASQRWW